MNDVAGTKNVTLTETPKKTKRQSWAWAVKQLEAVLTEKRAKLVIVENDYRTLDAEVKALTRAYEMVKPQPRKKKDVKS